MKTIKKECIFRVYENEQELDAADSKILGEAVAAVNGSYAPYSHFNVGAAVELENGSIIQGSNQENSAYPSGLCAERVALFYAGTNNNPLKIRAIAVTARSKGTVLDKPVYSCGACLQVMSDFEKRSGKPIRVILRGETGEIYVCDGIDNLMPLRFDL